MGVEFLEVAPLGDAVERVLEELRDHEIPEEEIDLAGAVGRIVAKSLSSPEDVPGFLRSSVDGFAVRAADTFGASETEPVFLDVVGEVPMGGLPDFSIGRSQTAHISTGGAIPSGADAVVMVEHTEMSGLVVSILKPVALGENVVASDDDIKKGTVICLKGTRLAPRHIGALAAVGITRVDVFVKPKVGIISTGDELIPPWIKPLPGQVRDVNTYALSAALKDYGCEPVSYGIVKDRFGELFEISRKALTECDALIISGGSSAGARDMTLEVISALGKPGVLIHGIRLKPGKPTLLGVCDGRVVAGFPGNPASALVVLKEVFQPILSHIKGERLRSRRGVPAVRASLGRSISSLSGRLEFVPVELTESEDGLVAFPVTGKSNLIGTLVRAGGFVRVPQDLEGFAQGMEVEVELAD